MGQRRTVESYAQAALEAGGQPVEAGALAVIRDSLLEVGLPEDDAARLAAMARLDQQSSGWALSIGTREVSGLGSAPPASAKALGSLAADIADDLGVAADEERPAK